MKCKICGEKLDNYRKLSKHIRDQHKHITIRQYYDMFFKSDDEGKCIECGNSTNWVSISYGYRPTCSQKCGAIRKRRELKNNEEKFNSFRNKVSINQSKIWENRSDVDKKQISNKLSEKLRRFNKKLSKEELIEKYGWLNKLPQDEKDKKVLEILNKSLNKWWREASSDDIEKVIQKRMNTKYDRGVAIPPEERSDYRNYESAVRSKSETTYRKYKQEIDPNNKRGQEYHLDHKISIFVGFLKELPIDMIASKYNLEIISAKNNMSKHCECSMEIKELIKIWESENQEPTRVEE